MSRTLTVVLVAVTLVVGITAGLAAGVLLSGSATAGPTPDVALGSPGPSSDASPSPSPAAAPSTQPPATPLPSYPPLPTPEPTPELVPAPLTGRLVSPAVAKRHVVGVMIDDQAAARPQSGLSDASVVWQAPAEGGIPRYMALFQEGNPKAVGPIRSSRYYFIAWAAEWKSVFVHVGGSPQAMALLRSNQGRGGVVFDADGFRYEGTYMWRINTRLAPHNVYTDARNLRELGKQVGAKDVAYETPWTFAPDITRDKRPKGGTIVVPYLANRITYAYDRKTNRYLRSVTAEGKQVDAANSRRVAPKNVVVMVMSFAPLNDGTTKRRLEAQFTGTGTAWIATNGKTVKGTWKKTSLTGPTRFYGKNGKQVVFTVGQTFIQVVPRGTRITVKDGKVPPLPPRPAVSGHVDPEGPLPR